MRRPRRVLFLALCLAQLAIPLSMAYRYERTRSLWAVCLEHTLYGWLVFTAGLGRFFFTGIASV